MKRLLIDTCVLLDLTILELGDPDFRNKAYTRLTGQLQRIKEIPHRSRLIDWIRDECFGVVEVSAGALIEMDQHAERAVVKGNKREMSEPAAMKDFWEGYERLPTRLSGRERSMLWTTLKFDWEAIPEDDRLRFGPVDAAALSLLKEDRERWFLTFDGLLKARALELAPARVPHLTDIIRA